METMTMQPHVRGAALAGLALIAAGCDRAARAPETVTQKIDPAAETAVATTKAGASKAAHAAEDATLTTKVKAALFAEPGIKTREIAVDTRDAVVTLQGNVESDTLRQRAVRLAGETNGVNQVIDKLVVKSRRVVVQS